MIKLLIFDLDGTLVDSVDDITRAVNRLLNQEGLASLSRTEIAFHIGEGLRKLLRDLLPNYSPGNPDYLRIESDFMRFYEEECTGTVAWMPHILEFLKAWPYKKAIITNKNWSPTLRILQHLGFVNQDWCFTTGIDSFPTSKPHPGPLIEAMRLAGAAPRETLMIGDGKPDIRAASAAGTWSAAIGFGYTEIADLQSWERISFCPLTKTCLH